MPSRCSIVLPRLRSTNTVRCSLASSPNSGQPATSALATKEIGIAEDSTVMSMYEV